MSKTNTKATTWPYAYKTVAMSCASTSYTMPFVVNAYESHLTLPVITSELALEIFPPLYIYQPTGLFMHLNYTFNSGIATGDQLLRGIYVRDTASPYVVTGIENIGDSTVQNYMPLNVQADVNRNINISLDLSSLLTGKPTNVVFLSFNPDLAWSIRTCPGDTINLWKLDLVYQTIGIRDEK